MNTSEYKNKKNIFQNFDDETLIESKIKRHRMG